MLRSFLVPKISTTTTSTISQCQMLKPPMVFSLVALRAGSSAQGSGPPITCMWTVDFLLPDAPGVDDGAEAVVGALLARELAGSVSILPERRRVVPAVTSYSVATCFFGMIRKCTGACGRMSWNASTSSSSYTFWRRDLAARRSCRRCSSDRCMRRSLVLRKPPLYRCGLGTARPASAAARPSRRARRAFAPRQLGQHVGGPQAVAREQHRQWNHRSAISATMRAGVAVLRGHHRLGRLLADLLQDRVVALREQRAT